MPAVDVAPGGASEPTLNGAAPAQTDGGRARARRWPWWLAVAALVAGSLVLRLWGIGHGMPYAYNADENAHFVPGAIGLFGHSWNPHYFVNPPAYTYLLHAVFAVWFGGRDGVSSAYATDPTQVFIAARATAAVVGSLAVWLTYLAGARFAGRPVGLLAAAMLAVAFLPVFYGHLALNDAPTLAPIALSLWGTAGVLRRGRAVDFLLAGAGLGLACATKYTGGIVVLPLVAAGLAGAARERGATAVVRGLVLAALAAIAGFLAANPYAVLDFAAFRDGLTHQADAAGDTLGKLGLTEDSGVAYYLWTFTWGLGWVPVLGAVAGLVVLAVRDRRLLAVLAPAPLVYLIFMGTQQRFFGRWLMPVFPICCILGAYAGWRLVAWVSARRPALAPLVAATVVAACVGQGLVFALHSAQVLSHEDTRNVTRAWMVQHVPVRTKIVVEPGVFPDAWASDIGGPVPGAPSGRRWTKFATSRSRIANDGALLPEPGRIVNVEDYERTLVPSLVDRYEREGWCYVVTGSTQRGRAEAQPQVVPRAIEYYRALERRADVVFTSSPYHRGRGPVGFNFDWSFDFYPLAYERPGPLVQVYRLRGGACARVS